MTVSSPTLERPARGVGPRVTQARVTRSEWIKLRSLRSTWIALAVAVLATVGLGALFGALTNARWDKMSVVERLTFSPADRSLVGVALAQLAVGVLGVLVISGEYGTGMIRATLAAVPRRLPVVWAKLLVFGVTVLVLMEVAAFAAFFAGQATLGTHSTTIGAPHVLRAVAGSGLYLCLIGLLGTGIGFALRSTAGSIAALFGLLLVLPGIVHALPSGWENDILPYLPSQAGSAFDTVRQSFGATLAPGPGVGVLVGWVVASVTAGALALRRRDA